MSYLALPRRPWLSLTLTVALAASAAAVKYLHWDDRALDRKSVV